MYSYEDRTRAVKLYIKLGKRAAATIPQLGYPTKNSLKSWHRELERCHDLPVGYVRSKLKYSDEQKNVVTCPHFPALSGENRKRVVCFTNIPAKACQTF